MALLGLVSRIYLLELCTLSPFGLFDEDGINCFNFWLSSVGMADEYLGNLSNYPYAPGSTANPASRYDPNSVANSQGTYGSPYSSKSATDPYASDAPKLYDGQGNYRGKLSANPYDPDSVSNPCGRYGSPYSPDSINNPYGAENPYSSDSPTNPDGDGLRIIGE